VRIAVLSDVAGGSLVWVVFKILPPEFSYDVRAQFSWLCGPSEINHQLFQYCSVYNEPYDASMTFSCVAGLMVMLTDVSEP
jgi:hypothetical protein